MPAYVPTYERVCLCVSKYAVCLSVLSSQSGWEGTLMNGLIDHL